jgi:hypothetical protein
VNHLWDFVVAHHTVLTLGGAWVFSAACSTMPPLRPDAGYFVTWLHDLMQAIAANLNRVKESSPVVKI